MRPGTAQQCPQGWGASRLLHGRKECQFVQDGEHDDDDCSDARRASGTMPASCAILRPAGMRLAHVNAVRRGATDRILAAAVERLHAEGLRIAGAVRAITPGAEAGHCDSALRLLPEGPVDAC